MSTIREEVLMEAQEIVTKDRNRDYDVPEQNFGVIAQFWSVYKDEEFTAHDVAVMLALLKVARIRVSPQLRDHWVDLAGYAACGAEVAPHAG